MNKKELIKEIRKALKEHESFYNTAGVEAYDQDTKEGYLAHLLNIACHMLSIN